MSLATRHDDATFPSDTLCGIEKVRQSNFGHNRCRRSAVREYVGIVSGFPKRVEGNRHDAGLDRTQEGSVEVDGIDETEKNSMLRAQPEFSQHARKTIDSFRKLVVGMTAGIVDNGDLAASSGVEVTLEEVDSGVVELGLSLGLHVWLCSENIAGCFVPQ